MPCHFSLMPPCLNGTILELARRAVLDAFLMCADAIAGSWHEAGVMGGRCGGSSSSDISSSVRYLSEKPHWCLMLKDCSRTSWHNTLPHHPEEWVFTRQWPSKVTGQFCWAGSVGISCTFIAFLGRYHVTSAVVDIHRWVGGHLRQAESLLCSL